MKILLIKCDPVKIKIIYKEKKRLLLTFQSDETGRGGVYPSHLVWKRTRLMLNAQERGK